MSLLFRSPVARVLLVTLALFSGALSLGTTAQAGTSSFCSTEYGPYDTCPGPAHSLTSVVSDNVSGGANSCAGARYQGSSTMYGSYFCATDFACHTYGGGNVLNPVIKNNVNSNQGLNGYSSWGSTGAFNGCPRGAASRIAPDNAVRRAALETALPIFAAPSDDSSRLPTEALKFANIAADEDGSRAFSTPRGNGWVLSDSRRNEICLVLADRNVGYGIACQPRRVALATGFAVGLRDESASSAATVVALQPVGSSQDLSANGGIAVASQDATRASVLISASKIS